MKYSWWIVGLLISLQLGLPAAAWATAPADTSQRVPLLVQEAEADLLASGCERVLLIDAQGLAAARSLKWQAVIPRDASGEAMIYCSPAVAGKLQPYRPGRVEAAFSSNYSLPGLAVLATWNLGKKLLSKGASATVGWGAKLATGALFSAIAAAAQYVIKIAAGGIPAFLAVSGFTLSPVVRMYWPWVLAMANLGFLLALVFIALLTALRIDIGGGVRRQLPRLLMAALLVNFSLVIGGLVVDASRIMMALTNARLDTLDDLLIIQSRTLGVDLWVPQAMDKTGWEEVAAALLTAVVSVVVALALLVVLFGLIIRYLMLLLLLIISPFAYLFLAFPNTGGLARRWWTTFLRYVIYGPVVLVLLLIALNVGQLVDNSGMFGVTPGEKATKAVLQALLFAAAIIMAAMAGRYAGIMGSAMAVNLATRTGKRLRGLSYRGARVGARAAYQYGVKPAAKGLYAGSGMRQRVRYARDNIKERLQPFRKQHKLAEYSPYDKKTGKIKPGRTTPGQEAGIMARSPSARAARRAAAGSGPAIATHPDLTPGALGSRDVSKTLREADIGNIMKNGSVAQKRALIVNVDVVRRMSDSTIAAAQSDVDADVRRSVAAAVRQINRQDNA